MDWKHSDGTRLPGWALPVSGPSSAVIPDAVVYLPLEDLVDFEKEKERLLKEKDRLEKELERSRKMLGNESLSVRHLLPRFRRRRISRQNTSR